MTMDWKRGVLLFTVVFALGLTLTRGLDFYFAKQAIARDAALLDRKFRLYFAESEQQLATLPEWDLTAPCDAERQKQLRKLVFDATFIRWLGVFKDGVMLCQNGALDRDILGYRLHRVSHDFSMVVAEVKRAGATGYEIGLVRQMDGYQYVASFTPLYPHHFMQLDCQNCLAYRIEFDTEPLLNFGFKAFNGVPVVEHTEQMNTPYYNASFQLSGNREFLNQYYNIGFIVSIIVGFCSAFLAVFSYWLWHKTRSSLEFQIREALKFGEFTPFYQPIVDSESNTLVGAEVLMRWVRNDGVLVPPNHFIPFAEASGLVVPMTRMLLDKVIADIAAMGSAAAPLFFSINIVPAHLKDDSLLTVLEGIVASGKLGVHRLSLEITERLPLTDLDTAKTVLDKIYALGIDLKLDDAGTGYGCFTYVQNLGVSTLKIDKMFIDTIGLERNFNGKTLDAIISFAKESNLKMIAEGVESQAQLTYLREQGVSLIQGYFYSKPLEAKAFFGWRAPT